MHLSAGDLERYRKRELPPRELLAAATHLAGCDLCRGNLADETRSGILLTAAPAHLTFEQLETYADGRADEIDREIVESHVELCEFCATQVEQLKTLAADLR